MCPNPLFPAHLVTFIEKILHRQLHFFCSALAVSQHLALFRVHVFSASGDIIYFIYHVTSQDHLIDASCKFIPTGSMILR